MPQRHTKQKDIILVALCRMKNHPTADAVYEEIHGEYPTISRSTVFRVLNQMSENRLASKISLPGAADCFDHRTSPHCHGRCSVCRKLFDLPAVSFPLQEMLPARTNGFNVTGCTVIFEGICENCLGKESDSEHG